MPQPIDLQTELVRVTAAERVQQTLDRASLAAQGRATAHLQHEVVQKETLVQPKGQAERPSIEDEERARQNRRKKREKPDPAADEAARTFYAEDEKRHVLDDPGEHHLDVTA